MSELLKSGGRGMQQGMQDISPAEENSSNIQCLEIDCNSNNNNNNNNNNSASQQPSTSSTDWITLRANSNGTTGDYCNQQVFPENVEVSHPQPPLRISRVHERCDGISITIPVDGTLSRTPKNRTAKPKANNNDGDEFKVSLRERNAPMFLNEWLADVHFVVGTGDNSERMPAHSYILAIASRPFNAMFNGGFDQNNEIELPDVEPAAFKVLLKYLYCDDIELDSSNALSTLYAAKKYMITYLARAAVDFLDFNLKAENVCSMLTQSRLFEEEELMDRCWKLVDVDAERVLGSDSFCDVDFTLFEQIISRKTLVVREKLLYEAAVKWAKAECRRRELPDSPMNMRNVLGDALYRIRFPAMTINEFADGPAKADLLTCQETKDIFLHFAAKEKPNLPFPVNKRVGLRLFSCLRFQAALQGANQWRYRGRCDSIQFLVDRRIYVAGYGLYGSGEINSQYKIKMDLKKGSELLESRRTTLYSTGYSEPILVHFDHPIQIESEIKYTASVTMEGKDLSFFGQEGMTEVAVAIDSRRATNDEEKDNFVNFYFTPSVDSKNGTGVQGGQIPIIIFYA